MTDVSYRYVVAEIKVRFVYSVPADWDQGTIDFSLSEANCGDNRIKLLQDQIDRWQTKDLRYPLRCFCYRISDQDEELHGRYIREATEDDLKWAALLPKEDE